MRLWNLSVGDLTGSDEVLYSFRAIGLLDFDLAKQQTTPLEWTDPNVPWWAKLSFHDHPPLVFLVQNVFMKIFGENYFAFRLPSAIFGVLSVYLVYLIIQQLNPSKKIALLASSFTAVTVNHVYISRLAIQESYVIFFLLLGSLLFLKSLRQDKYLLWLGLALGLSFLTKYTTFILVPIFISYLLFFQRDYFKNKKLWLAILMTLAISSPILIYNIQLYRNFGHFDFQISYIFGQQPEVWKAAPGKEEIGSLMNRLRNFIPNLYKTNSPVFISLFFISIFSLMSRDKRFLDLSLFWLIILMFFVGPTNRFLTMLTPFIAMETAWFFNDKIKFISILLSAFLIFEVLYSFNSQILAYPFGPQFWAFSKIRYDQYDWGYRELDKFLRKELEGKMPLMALNLRYKFLEAIQNKAIAQGKAGDLEIYPALIIYDYNFHESAQLWNLERLQIYHAWPILKTEEYLSMLNQNGSDFFEKAGIKTYYFIKPTEKLPLKRADKLTNAGALFEQELLKNNIFPAALYNKRGDEVFRIYKF